MLFQESSAISRKMARCASLLSETAHLFNSRTISERLLCQRGCSFACYASTLGNV